jgi:hypothetical protein
MPLRRTLAALLPFICAPAMAQQPAPPEPALAARAAGRFPQPVRVGDLLHRQVLRPVEQQNVLGRVAGVVRHPDGAVLIVVSLGGVLGLGTRPVAVPVEATALLGEHLALMDLTPEQLRALPTFDGAGAAPVPPDATTRVGLVRPFH